MARATKKNSTKSTTPRRSGSQFTSPLDAYLVREERPTSITQDPKSGEWIVRVNGRMVGRTASQSSARRLRYKSEQKVGFKVNARTLASKRAAHVKSTAKSATTTSAKKSAKKGAARKTRAAKKS